LTEIKPTWSHRGFKTAARASGLLALQPYPEEWLLVEWPQGESAPTKYWLSTLPADTDLATLVAAAKMRWWIERDYQELKQQNSRCGRQG
jgi:SRSO17 transposase